MKTRFLWLVLCAWMAGCGGSTTPEAKKETPAPAAAPVAVPDAGTISGKITFAGERPKPRPLSMDATPVCAKMHTGPILAEDVIIAGDGALKNTFVWIKSGLAARDYPVPATPVKLDQVGCVYTPHVVGVMVNQTLEISNSDDTNHNIHPMPRVNREWNESQPPKGEVKVKKFDKEEVPPIMFKCNVHPWMRAWVGVVSHPYFAVTDAAGKFELKDVPPGDYVLGAWHERFGAMEMNVKVEPKAAAAASFTFKAQ
jgi:plastocyanin